MPIKKAATTTTLATRKTTVAVDVDTVEKLKAIAYWDNIALKDVVINFLHQGIVAYEKKNGAIKQRQKDEG